MLRDRKADKMAAGGAEAQPEGSGLGVRVIVRVFMTQRGPICGTRVAPTLVPAPRAVVRPRTALGWVGQQGRGRGAVGGKAWTEGKLRQWRATWGGPALVPRDLSSQRHGRRQGGPRSFGVECPPGDMQGTPHLWQINDDLQVSAAGSLGVVGGWVAPAPFLQGVSCLALRDP